MARHGPWVRVPNADRSRRGRRARLICSFCDEARAAPMQLYQDGLFQLGSSRTGPVLKQLSGGFDPRQSPGRRQRGEQVADTCKSVLFAVSHHIEVGP